MIPMHFFSTYTLNRFMERISKDWDVETSVVPSVVLSKHTLADKAEASGVARTLVLMAWPEITHRQIAAERDRDACRRMRRRVRWC